MADYYLVRYGNQLAYGKHQIHSIGSIYIMQSLDGMFDCAIVTFILRFGCRLHPDTYEVHTLLFAQ